MSMGWKNAVRVGKVQYICECRCLPGLDAHQGGTPMGRLDSPFPGGVSPVFCIAFPDMMDRSQLPDLVCPAGSLPALKAAVDNGADAVYLGYKNDTNARNFAGLNFEPKTMAEGIRYAHDKGREVLLAINTFAQAGRVADWQKAVDAAVDQGVDAIILADVGLLDYARNRHPQQRLHLSVQGSATSYEAINFCQREFGVRRAVLPRVLTLAQVEHVIKNTSVEIEVFGFGSLCVMNEGRCWLSSCACG